MSTVEQINVDTVIPDGIEPVEAWRCWRLENGQLCSINAACVWTAGKALTASCSAGYAESYEWRVARRGMTTAQAQERADSINAVSSYSYSIVNGAAYTRDVYCPSPPSVSLPDGYGLELDVVTHDAPHEDCSCGIYAGTDEKTVEPYRPSAQVYGRVKLWGKIVPGSRGVRAQYAYPSEFRVSGDLIDNPALMRFGVPIVKDDSSPSPSPTFGGMQQFVSTNTTRPRTGMNPYLKAAVAANIAAAAINMGDLALRLL